MNSNLPQKNFCAFFFSVFVFVFLKKKALFTKKKLKKLSNERFYSNNKEKQTFFPHLLFSIKKVELFVLFLSFYLCTSFLIWKDQQFFCCCFCFKIFWVILDFFLFQTILCFFHSVWTKIKNNLKVLFTFFFAHRFCSNFFFVQYMTLLLPK